MIQERNEEIPLAIEVLLENFLVQRKDDPELFRKITSYEKTIRKYLVTNFGYQLKIDSDVAKVDKIPYYSREWMGIQNFKNELDYVFLMAVLSNLETKSYEYGLLLSDFIKDVKMFLQDIYEVDWMVRHQRESLVRALTYVQEIELIKIKDGELSDFEKSEEGDALYDVTTLVRYQFRNLSKKMDSYQNLNELLFDGLDKENPHQSLFRKLYFEPVVFFEELTKEEVEYISNRNNYEYVKYQIEQYTSFELERQYHCIYITNSEKKMNLQQHPGRKHDSQIVSQVAYMLVEKLKDENQKPFGLLTLTDSEFENLLLQTKTNFDLGWSSKVRQQPFTKLKQDVLEYMVQWKLATYDLITMELTIYPPFIRSIGDYEADVRDYINAEMFRRNKNV